MEYAKDNHIQKRINEAKYYLSFGKTDDALERLLPVLIYLKTPHYIVDRMYVLETIASITMLDGFKRAKSFLSTWIRNQTINF